MLRDDLIDLLATAIVSSGVVAQRDIDGYCEMRERGVPEPEVTADLLVQMVRRAKRISEARHD